MIHDRTNARPAPRSRAISQADRSITESRGVARDDHRAAAESAVARHTLGRVAAKLTLFGGVLLRAAQPVNHTVAQNANVGILVACDRFTTAHASREHGVDR